MCKKCKKIYKTRQLCRVRDGHTDLPWNTTYICFIVDESCTVNGRFVQQEGDRFVAETIQEDVPPLPYVADLSKLGPNPPICRMCKEKNYTRYHCRTNHCHKQLPWGTTYAVLKRIENGDGSLSHDCGDSVDGSISVPTLDSSPIADYRINDYTESRNDYDYAERPLKRQVGNDQEERAVIKRMRTNVHEKRNGLAIEDISQIAESKAFVLVIHDEVPTLHVSDC